MTTGQVESCLFVVSHQARVDSSIFVATIQLDSIAAVIADGQTLQEDFVHKNSFYPVPAFLLTGDAKLTEHDSP